MQRRVIAALERLIAEPPAGDLVKLTGREEWRHGSGTGACGSSSYHAAKAIVVLRVLPRGRAYRD